MRLKNRSLPVQSLIGLLLLSSSALSVHLSYAAELSVGKACPVYFHEYNLGLLVVSEPWFHVSRSKAAYIASDNATGVGVEIHFFANETGDVRYKNIAQCNKYRMIQVRKTTAKLFQGEQALQLDLPLNSTTPFYDEEPREFGHGTHDTPLDNSDKPWQGRPVRSSTVAIYDTPYVSDSYGQEGEDIHVQFETCVVCERETSTNSLLSCLSWGYVREFMGGQTGWSEPESLDSQCEINPSRDVEHLLKSNQQLKRIF